MPLAINLVYKYGARTISELYDKCTQDEFASLIYECADYTKSLTRALELFIKDSLELQRRNRWEYFLSCSDDNLDEEQEILRLFNVQGIDPVIFANDLRSVLLCEHPKINCLKIYGVPNSGKSMLAQLIVSSFITCYANNHGSENEFFLSNFLNKSIILCEELYVTVATAEDFKSILGGALIDISKKHKEKQLLQRTPVIITSNYKNFGRGHLSKIDENALTNRCREYYFRFPFKPNVTITAPSLAHFMFIACNQDMI